MRLSFVLLTSLFFCMSAHAASSVINVYNWSDYLPAKVIKEFEKKTGITVVYSEYNSNAALYTKLKSDPQVGYDVIFPSSYTVDRMRKQGMLHKLDKAKLPYLKYYNPRLLNKAFDPHNHYSVPYLWGTTGIAVNSKYITPSTITQWSDLWQKRFKNKLLIFNDMRDAFSVALITLGYSINDTNPQHIYQAYKKLKTLLPNIKLFNSDAEKIIYIDGDIHIGMGWSGDIYLAHSANPNIKYIYPKEGFPIWIDCLAITTHAPHLANAYRFINFLMQPKVAAQIAIAEGYSTPNQAALKYFPNSLRTNPMVNPSEHLLQRGQFQLDLGKAHAIYETYWQLLKISA